MSVAAVTGATHYLWAVKKDTFFPLVYLAIFIALLGFRLWDHFSKRTGASQTPAPSSTPIGAAELFSA